MVGLAQDDNNTISDDFNTFTTLFDPMSVDVFEREGRSYALVTANGDNGVSVLDVTDPSNPAPVCTAKHGQRGFDRLEAPVGAAVAQLSTLAKIGRVDMGFLGLHKTT